MHTNTDNREEGKELFTPGEWICSKEQGKRFGSFNAVNIKDEPQTVAIVYGIGPEGEATGQLIAASKDLYFALKECHNILKSLANQDKYPDEMIQVNGGKGFGFITNALRKANPNYKP